MTMKATCHACGQDCTHANATHNGDIYHVGCLPATKRKARERFCFNCGDSLGIVEDRYHDRKDTCGKTECNRAAGDAEREEREHAHDALDRSHGWGDYDGRY